MGRLLRRAVQIAWYACGVCSRVNLTGLWPSGVRLALIPRPLSPDDLGEGLTGETRLISQLSCL